MARAGGVGGFSRRRRLDEAATPQPRQAHQNNKDDGIGEKTGQRAHLSGHARLTEDQVWKGKRDNNGAEAQAKAANGPVSGNPRQSEDDAKDHDPSRIERLSRYNGQ